MTDPWATKQSLPNSVLSARPVLIEEGPSAGLPAHFGWPSAEQESYESGVGLAFLGSTGVVKVSGVDRLTWLHNLTSQELRDVKPGMSKETLFLDTQGHIAFAAGVIDDGQATWLLVEPGYSTGLAGFLNSMKFMLRVEVADASASYVAFRSANEGEVTVGSHKKLVEGVSGIVWDDPWPGVTPGGAKYAQEEHPSAKFRTYIVPIEAADEFVGDFFGDSSPQFVGFLAAEATRVSSWRPQVSSEVDEKTNPAELDWLRTAVHLSKGCYRGQETIAHIVNLGKPPRRLVFLQIDGSRGELPKAGAEVTTADGAQVGLLTSIATHFEMGPIGLAVVRRSLDPLAPLKVGQVDAVQEIIVPVDGKSDHSPATRPGLGLKRLDSGKRDIRTTGPRVKL